MNWKIYSLLIALMISGVSCNLPGPGGPGIVEPTAPVSGMNQAVSTSQPSGPAPALSRYLLPDLATVFPPPPIVPIPKSSFQIGGESFDAYQVPGDRFRVLCKQPCGLNERLMDALYVSYKVTAQADVRTAGFDVLDKMSVLDIHLDRDNECTRFENELGLTTSYKDNPDSIVICLYLTDPQIQAAIQADPTNSFTPEGAIRNGGLGVFAHEYAHALFFGRFASSHDYVFPIEYVTLRPDNFVYYSNLCESLYQNSAPLSYQLCQKNGFSFNEMIQSLLDINRLYDGGFGDLQGGMVSYNQYRVILENILGGDIMPAFNDAGYQKILIEEGNTPYTLPYAGESCTYRAQLVSDGTVPPGTMLDANAPFEKTWRIKNTGTCNWDNAQLVYVRGEAMTSTLTVPVPATTAGSEVDVTVPMTAPSEAGVHVGEWRLRNTADQDFGPIINLTLYTRPGCSLPPALSFFKAEPATIGSGALSLLSWGQVTNVDKVEIVGLGSVDPNGSRLLVQPDRTTTYTLQTTCGSQSASSTVTVTVDPSLPPFAISDVNTTADPAQFSGSCSGGIPIYFFGTFISSGPGVVMYQWESSDGAVSDPGVSILDKAGTQSITTYWTLSGSMEGWKEFKLLAPLDAQAVRANFTLTCTP